MGYIWIIVVKIDFSILSNSDVSQEIGRRLRIVRLNADLSQSELAKLAGISESTVKRAETANGNITVMALIAMLRALRQIDQLDLFLPEPPPNPAQLVVSKGKTKQRASKTNRIPSSAGITSRDITNRSRVSADTRRKNINEIHEDESELQAKGESSAKPFSWGDE